MWTRRPSRGSRRSRCRTGSGGWWRGRRRSAPRTSHGEEDPVHRPAAYPETGVGQVRESVTVRNLDEIPPEMIWEIPFDVAEWGDREVPQLSDEGRARAAARPEPLWYRRIRLRAERLKAERLGRP